MHLATRVRKAKQSEKERTSLIRGLCKIPYAGTHPSSLITLRGHIPPFVPRSPNGSRALAIGSRPLGKVLSGLVAESGKPAAWSREGDTVAILAQDTPRAAALAQAFCLPGFDSLLVAQMRLAARGAGRSCLSASLMPPANQVNKHDARSRKNRALIYDKRFPPILRHDEQVHRRVGRLRLEDCAQVVLDFLFFSGCLFGTICYFFLFSVLSNLFMLCYSSFSPNRWRMTGHEGQLWSPRRLQKVASQSKFGIHYRGVQSEGGAVDGGSIIK